MKISEIITDKYKLRIPPTVYYNLLADVVEAEGKQELILNKISAEVKALSPEPTAYDVVDGNPVKDAVWETIGEVRQIIDKYKAESEGATVSDKEPMVGIDLYPVIKQSYIEREVLDKIRAEIEQSAFDDVNGSKFISVNRVNQIIDKCKAESEVKANENEK